MNGIKKLVAGSAFVIGGLAAAAVGSAAFAQDLPQIAKGDVRVELSDVNANALQYWPNIEEDLEAALNREILPYAVPEGAEGYEIVINLSEISIDGSALLGNEGEFNTLEGWVYIREPGNDQPVEDFGLTMTAKTGAVAPGTRVVIAPSDTDFYEALLQRFADRAVDAVEQL